MPWIALGNGVYVIKCQHGNFIMALNMIKGHEGTSCHSNFSSIEDYKKAQMEEVSGKTSRCPTVPTVNFLVL
jgi:hypothetical protein